jgi:hypothetical protein
MRIPHQGIDLETMKRDLFSTKEKQMEASVFGAQKVPMINDVGDNISPSQQQRQAAQMTKAKFGAQNQGLW